MKTPVMLTDTDRIRLEAVNKLLDSQSAEIYQSELEEMFEGWITSYLVDGLEVNDRGKIWFCYRFIKDFFESVKTIS